MDHILSNTVLQRYVVEMYEDEHLNFKTRHCACVPVPVPNRALEIKIPKTRRKLGEAPVFFRKSEIIQPSL